MIDTSRRLGPAVIGIFGVLLGGLLLSGVTHAWAEPVRVGHVEAELVADVAQIIPGEPFQAGVRFKLDDHWHVYWRNPGDAGLAPKLSWELPTGFRAGDIQWPYPEKISVPPLVSYGYHGEVLLSVTITPPDDFTPGDTVHLRLRAEWLVCKEECVPGKAELELALPVGPTGGEVQSKWTALFNTALEKLPLQGLGWTAVAQVDDTTVAIELTAPSWYADTLTDITFFPFRQQLIENAAVQRLARTASGYRLEVERSHFGTVVPDTVYGVMVAKSGWRGPDSEKGLEIAAPVVTTDSGAVAARIGGLSRAILLAFLGGMILNLMPCVLPVLSLKVLSLARQANESRRQILFHSLIFTAGVLVSFWILAGGLALLRAGGEQLGWGFQLQSPTFVIVLASFLFLFALNLMGLFEIGTSLGRVGGAARGGRWGSFLTGALATLVATPCTAPFMGSALAFSLTQPGWAAWVIFTSLGLGMAAPYVALALSPALLRFLPRPGRWMETLKQVMGLLLLATVIWLTWVLGLQAGIDAVGVFLGGLLALATGAWVYGRWGGPASGRGARFAARSVALALLALGLGTGLAGVTTLAATPGAAVQDTGGIAWQPYDRAQIDDWRRTGETILIDFTAAWCLSCQVNERVAFGASEVRARLAHMKVRTVKADWTSRNAEITRALAEFGRNSVPLYVLYGPGREPVILPEILTPGLVLEALEKIDG